METVGSAGAAGGQEKELRQIFRDPRTKRIIFASPIVQLLAFGYAVNTDVDTMPYFFERLPLLNPLRHFLEIVRACFLKGAGFGELWVQFTTLTAMAVAGLMFAARRFQRSMV